jgi:hypothetical protein
MASPLEHLSRPNLPEITSTTLPLLSTVLAGFAVTIIATLLTQANVSKIWPLPNLFWSLVLLAISAPLLLTSTFFAVRAQAYSYLTLTSEVQNFLKLHAPATFNFDNYVERIYKKWLLWYEAADFAFSLGLLTFVGGTGLLLWNYVGLVGALIFLGITILAIIGGIWLQIRENKMI